MNLTKQTVQSIGMGGMAGVYYKMGEYMFSDSLMLRRSGRKRLPNSIHVIV